MQELSDNIISMDEMTAIIKEQLGLGGNVKFTPKGNSMLPLLRNNKDVVVLKKQKGPLRKYDIPLYQRSNGTYVLHRVIKVNPDGSYVMCGDNQTIKEYGITDENIIGVVESFERKGKQYSCRHWGYKIYCKVWIFILPLRRQRTRVRRFLGKVKRKWKSLIIVKGKDER